MIFSATFDGSSTIQYKVTAGQGDSKNSQYTPTNWFSTVAGKGIQTMQFPIQNLTVAAKLDNDDSSSSSSNVGHQTLQPSSVFDSVSDPNQLAADIQSASPEESVIVQHMLAGLYSDVAAATSAVPEPSLAVVHSTAAAPSAVQTQNLQTLNFPGCTSAFTIAATSVKIDPVAFTGRKFLKPAYNAALGVGYLVDTPGEFTSPVKLTC